jgi:hypothetical protein
MQAPLVEPVGTQMVTGKVTAKAEANAVQAWSNSHLFHLPPQSNLV